MKKTKALIIFTLACALLMSAAGIAMVSFPSAGEPEEKSALYYITRGDGYYGDGDYDLALACYQKALTIQADNIDALHGAALSNGALEYTDDAIAGYDALLALIPDDTDIQMERVNLMIVGGYLEEAKATLEEMMASSPTEEVEKLYQQTTVSAPEVTLASGSYDSYQRAILTSGSNQDILYYTLDGSEPTSASNLYTMPLVISRPETTLKVKAINYLGYESPTQEYRYTITVPVEEVLWRDYSSMAYAIRETLDKSYRQSVYNYELAQITELYVVGDGYFSNIADTEFFATCFKPGNYTSGYSSRGDGDLSLLEHMPFLETLAVCWQNSVDLSAISGLAYLKNLSLLSNHITDISPLAKMTNLEKLALGWNDIQNIDALKNLSNLTSLGLWDNRITDLDAVSGLTSLQYLDIANNRITNLDALSGLDKLQEFWANGNSISSIAPLGAADTLRVVMLSGNPLTDYTEWKQSHPNLIRTDFQG